MSAHWALDDKQAAAVAYRLLVDASLDADRMFWERRARELEAARPRRGDFPGGHRQPVVDVDWNRGWPTTCGIPGCSDQVVENPRCRHPRHALRLDEVPQRPPGEGATPQDLVAAWDRLTEAAAACRARAKLTDVSRAQAEETLTDLASGAAS